MGECICNGCKNLKAVIKDESGETDYKCRFGFPSENCEQCSEEDCEALCEHFVEDSDFEGRTVKCAKCGKEMLQSSEDEQDGEVYCITCYLEGRD